MLILNYYANVSNKHFADMIQRVKHKSLSLWKILIMQK